MTKCTGNSYFKTDFIKKNLEKGKNMSRVVDNILSDYYEFYGYKGFVTKVSKIIGNVKNKYSNIKNKKEVNKYIKKD